MITKYNIDTQVLSFENGGYKDTILALKNWSRKQRVEIVENEIGNQPIRTRSRYLGHVTGNQPIRDQLEITVPGLDNIAQFRNT